MRSFFSNPVQLVFAAAMLFAAASTGFFVAVLLQRDTHDSHMAVLKPLSPQEKADVMHSLAESTDTQGQRPHAPQGTTTASTELSPAEMQRRMDILNSLKHAR